MYHVTFMEIKKEIEIELEKEIDQKKIELREALKHLVRAVIKMNYHRYREEGEIEFSRYIKKFDKIKNSLEIDLEDLNYLHEMGNNTNDLISNELEKRLNYINSLTIKS